MATLARAMLDALMPSGAAWNARRGGGMDRLLDGCGGNWQKVIDAVDGMRSSRDPHRIRESLLDDIEKDFGTNPRGYLSAQVRRQALASRVYRVRSIASYAKLQAKLDGAGFGKGGYGLAVMPNQSPAANPDALVGRYPRAYYLGNEIVSSSTIKYEGYGDMAYGEPYSVYGHYSGFGSEKTEFFTPPAKYWPCIFLVCSQVLEREEDGSIRKVAGAELPLFRKNELHRIILETKPLGTWALVFAQYAYG